MNYYEHHIRDYDAATAHLSWDQDMAYSRLLRWYYRKEQPIPADLAEVWRLLRATTKPQRSAVESVLKEFFELRQDGWHKDTCDAAIEKFKAGEPERAAKQQNEMTRLARHRAERATLFGEINKAGLHLPYHAPISEVRALVERIRSEAATPETLPATTATFHATGTATPATHLQRLPSPQSPVPRHQTPDTSTQGKSESARARGESDPKTPEPAAQSTAHELTERIRAAYPAGTYRGSNWILAERAIGKLLDEGETADALFQATGEFHAQQFAKGSIGTQFVLSPEKFFGPDGHWRGPFPLPAANTTSGKKTFEERMAPLYAAAGADT